MKEEKITKFIDLIRKLKQKKDIGVPKNHRKKNIHSVTHTNLPFMTQKFQQIPKLRKIYRKRITNKNRSNQSFLQYSSTAELKHNQKKSFYKLYCQQLEKKHHRRAHPLDEVDKKLRTQIHNKRFLQIQGSIFNEETNKLGSSSSCKPLPGDKIRRDKSYFNVRSELKKRELKRRRLLPEQCQTPFQLAIQKMPNESKIIKQKIFKPVTNVKNFKKYASQYTTKKDETFNDKVMVYVNKIQKVQGWKQNQDDEMHIFH